MPLHNIIMSLSLKDGDDAKPLAVIRGNSDKRLKNEVLYVNFKNDAFQELELDGDMKFYPLPDLSSARTICYVAGKSGSGKSTYCASWLREYKKIFPDNPIYLFSEVDHDDILDAVGVHRIKINSSLVTNPINLEECADSVIMFDDVDDISNKKVRDAVFNLMDKGLQMGRHHNISMLVTYHLITNGKETRKILNESHYITIFPSAGKVKGLKYFLSEYLELDKKQRTKLRKLPSRWVTIRNCAPMCILSEHNAYMLKDEDEDKKSK